MRKNFLKLAISLIAVLILSTPAFGTPWEDCGVTKADYDAATLGVVKCGELLQKINKFIVESHDWLSKNPVGLSETKNLLLDVVSDLDLALYLYPCGAKAYFQKASAYFYLAVLPGITKRTESYYINLALENAIKACDEGIEGACKQIELIVEFMDSR